MANNAQKKHLISINAGNGRKQYFLVTGAEFDGKHYRVSSETWMEICRRMRISAGEGVITG